MHRNFTLTDEQIDEAVKGHLDAMLGVNQNFDVPSLWKNMFTEDEETAGHGMPTVELTDAKQKYHRRQRR